MPPKRPRNLRTSTKSLADWDETPETTPAAETDTDSTTKKVELADLLEYQKLRRQIKRGIDIETLSKGTRHKSQPQEPAFQDVTTAATGRSLSGAFTLQTNKLDANTHMMAFIEKEMKRHRGTDDPEADEAAVDADDIYRLPEHLQAVSQKPVAEGNVAMAAKMLTSIQEVDLGRDSKIRNIVETDRVVSQISKKDEGHRGSRRVAGSKDLAANPRGSSAPRDAEAEMTGHGHGAGRYKRMHDSSERSSKATDDIVLQRFKKRMRR
ncbi:hypothetical protein LPJ66_011110 [Kickxella alabastrina]|uniref:Uncharacterized protein n=1 Tax=Kickxella alabastrina TaxID=61397 RepID=A0ACC1I287_9FUNG|nr:hypothetical protein LPJ66_011110 [Kickxella alabastrina]